VFVSAVVEDRSLGSTRQEASREGKQWVGAGMARQHCGATHAMPEGGRTNERGDLRCFGTGDTVTTCNAVMW
jgi:hypothetical protein